MKTETKQTPDALEEALKAKHTSNSSRHQVYLEICGGTCSSAKFKLGQSG